MTYITASDAYTSPHQSRYFAEVVSNEVDLEGIPKCWKILDILVSEPTQAAVEKAIAECGFLKGFELISYWVPNFDEAPF